VEKMQCAGFEEDDYAFYALGSLPVAREAEIDGHLSAGCRTCATGVRSARFIWTSVALAAPPALPSAGLRRKLMESVTPVGAGANWWQAWWIPALAGAATVFLVVGAVVPFAWQRLAPPVLVFSPVYSGPVLAPADRTQLLEVVRTVPGPPTVASAVPDPRQAEAAQLLSAELAREREHTAQLEATLAAVQARARELAAVRTTGSDDVQQRLASMTARSVELERQVTQYRVLLERGRSRADQSLQMVSMLSDPGLRVIRLRGTERGPALEGHAVIAGGGQMVFYGSQLPVLPANRTYQLWVVGSKGRAVASAGTFNPDSQNRATLHSSDPALLTGMTALAITDEPAGGSAKPTGHKWLIGS
jgi:anti-sigma-K factor RskA